MHKFIYKNTQDMYLKFLKQMKIYGFKFIGWIFDFNVSFCPSMKKNPLVFIFRGGWCGMKRGKLENAIT